MSTDGDVECGRSVLVRGLITEVMWGFMSPVQAHRIATWGAEDGIQKSELLRFAKMGSGGVHTRNVWRDITTKLNSPLIAKSTDRIKLPMLDEVGEQFDCATDVLLPHRLLAAMWESNRNEFDLRILGGDASNITRFWREMEQTGHPSYVDHPMHNHPRFDHRTSAIPIAPHFDGVSSVHCGRSWAKTVEAGSFTSLLAKPGAAYIQDFLMFIMFKEMFVPETMERLWTEVIWSFYWAYQGVHPDRDSSRRRYTPEDGWRYEKRGKPLCGGYFYPVFLIR